jgi:nucleoside-diphosphate-sugar epimerase
VTGTESLLNAAVDSGVQRFIFFSSVKAVADPGNECVDECWVKPATDDYGRSKRAAEQRVLAVGERYGMHVCNLRPCLTYGPGVKGKLLRMLKAVERKRFPPIPEFGSRRSMISLNDLVTVACLAMSNFKANNQTYIVSDGEEYSTRMMYESICNTMCIPLPRWRISAGLLQLVAILGDNIEWATKREMPFNSKAMSRLSGSACYCSERIQSDLDWRPCQTFPDVLPEMIESSSY